MTNKTTRAVIYVRYSDNKQNDSFSIEYQIEECTKYIELKEYTPVKTYIDAAQTGKKTAGRESFHEMIADADRGLFDKIIVFSFSRSFRNTRDALNYNHDLYEKHGIRIESVIEQIDLSNPHGKFSATNLFAMHELQSDIIAAHVKSGMYIAAKQGYYLGGFCPFGYELFSTGELSRGKDRKKFKINEKEANIIKRFFDMYADGVTLTQLNQYCIDNDIRGRRGDILSINTLASILRNAFYIGTREYSIKGYEKVYIENCVPAIIDAATWHKVQARHETNKLVKPRQTKRLYSLTGKIFCANCGGHFFGTHRNRKHEAKEYYYYECSKKKLNRTCKNKNVRKDKLEKFCIDEIKKHILNPAAIDAISIDICSRVQAAPDNAADKIKKLNARKEKINGIIKEIRRDIYEKNVDKETGNEMIKEYQKELTQIEIELPALESMLAYAITPDKIKAYLNKMLSDLNGSNEQIIKMIFDKLIEKIIIRDNEIEVYLIVAPFNVQNRDNEQCGQPKYNLSLIEERKKISRYE